MSLQRLTRQKHFDAAGPGLRLLPGFGAQTERPNTAGSEPPPAPPATHNGIRKRCGWGIFGAPCMCLCQGTAKVASPKHFDAAGPDLRLPPGFGAQTERPNTTGSEPPPAPPATHNGIRKRCGWGIFGAPCMCLCQGTAKVASPKHFDAAGPDLRLLPGFGAA